MRKERGAGGPDLQEQAQNWSTPTTALGESGGSDCTGKRRPENLASQVKTWATPTARMHKGGGQAVTRADGKSRLDMLDWQAEAFDPSSFPAPPIAGGSTSSTDGRNSNQPSARRRLNPIFVEALMRWPIGWTDFGCSETGSTRWRQDMRGFVWMLVTASAERESAQGRLL